MTTTRRVSAVDGGRPLGIPCPEHASTTIAGRCYWHAKAAHLNGEHMPLEARQWCGFDLPQPDADWRTDRGWRGAEDAVRDTPQDDERYEAYRGVRWLIDLGDATAELSV